MNTTTYVADLQALCALLEADHELTPPDSLVPASYYRPLDIMVDPIVFRRWLDAIGEHNLTVTLDDSPLAAVRAVATATPPGFTFGITVTSIVLREHDDVANLAALAVPARAPQAVNV